MEQVWVASGTSHSRRGVKRWRKRKKIGKSRSLTTNLLTKTETKEGIENKGSLQKKKTNGRDAIMRATNKEKSLYPKPKKLANRLKPMRQNQSKTTRKEVTKITAT